MQEKTETCFADVLWNTSCLFKNMCPSWSGYISETSNTPIMEESSVSLLPIIDLFDLIALIAAISEIVEIQNNNPCSSDRAAFFSNFVNKSRFVNALTESLRNKDFTIIQCPMDADTTIVKNYINHCKRFASYYFCRRY